MAKRLRLGPEGPQKREARAAPRQKGRGIFSGRAKLIALLVIVIAAASIIIASLRGRAIVPVGEDMRRLIQQSEGPSVAFVDRLLEVYEALPAEAKQQVASKGEYAFHLSDLPKAQADVIRGLLSQDTNLRMTLEGWVGSPLDLSKITFLFQRQGKYLALVCRGGGNEGNWAPFALWPGREWPR
jgi:hypothetical protein